MSFQIANNNQNVKAKNADERAQAVTKQENIQMTYAIQTTRVPLKMRKYIL